MVGPITDASAVPGKRLMAPNTSTERMSLIIAIYLAVKAVECYGEDKIGVMLSTSEGFIYTRKFDI